MRRVSICTGAGKPKEAGASWWMLQGDCAAVPPESFFPAPGEDGKAAAKVCAGCPVRQTCLDWALDTRQPSGVWGGLTTNQREAILRDRRTGGAA